MDIVNMLKKEKKYASIVLEYYSSSFCAVMHMSYCICAIAVPNNEVQRARYIAIFFFFVVICALLCAQDIVTSHLTSYFPVTIQVYGLQFNIIDRSCLLCFI